MKASRTWYPLTGSIAPSREVRTVMPKTTGRLARSRGVQRTSPKKPERIDPLTGPKQALAGRVVTMNDAYTVLDDGVVYIEKGSVLAVQERGRRVPDGFEDVAVVETGGTLFPGLIELHNHLSYNALPLWAPVPKRFEHRGQWPDFKDYRPMISGPMTVIGEYRDENGQPALLPALVRYVECKCLLGGVTTSQGIMLASNSGIRRFFRGIIRNVEQTDDSELPEAQGRIADVDAKDARRFLTQLKKEKSCFLLHLSEGVTDPSREQSVARRHFLALEVAPGEWALDDVFAGIHAAGLLPEDFDVLARYQGSMVWSPLSNLLLYGGTARVEAARAAGVRIGLGSDWSPTGSKNLLGELKVAWLYSQHELDGLLTPRDLVAMATRDAASILKWEKSLGTIEAARRANLLVIAGAADDAYESLLRTRETDVLLVMINGIARYGAPALMEALAPGDETVRVGGELRRLFLKQETGDPDVAAVSLGTATASLDDALRNIARLAKKAETPKPVTAKRRVLDAFAPPVWSLALDEIHDRGVDLGPRLPFNGPRDFTGPRRAMRGAAQAAPLLSAILQPISLDPLTVADDEDFLDAVAEQRNVPEAIRNDLKGLY